MFVLTVALSGATDYYWMKKRMIVSIMVNQLFGESNV